MSDMEQTTTTTTPLEDYRYAVQRMNSTMRVTAGCGMRAQIAIDNEYTQLQETYAKLSNDDKTRVGTLSACPKASDDGTGGMASGMAATAQTLRW